MHEFGHLILGETVIDLPEESLQARNNIEAWCNSFSSAFLLPKEVSIDIFNKNKHKLTETDTLNINYATKTEIKSAKLTDNPELTASEYRKILNLDIE